MTDHRQHDDPLAGLLKRTLASQASTHADCPEPEILAAYFERSLAATESAGWDQHFSACTRCQEQLAVLARVATAHAPAASAPAAAQPQPRSLASFWKLRWLAPAAAALAAVTVWLVLTAPDRRQALHSGDTSTIAENRQAPPASGEPSRADAPPAETPAAKIAAENLKNREGKAGLRSQPDAAATPLDAIEARAAAAKIDKDIAASVGRTEAGAKSADDEKFAFSARRRALAQPPSVAELPAAGDKFKVQPMAPAEPARREPGSGSLLDAKAASEAALEADKQKAKEEEKRSADQVAALAAAKPAPPSPVPAPTAPPPSVNDKLAAATAPARRARVIERQGMVVTRDEAKKKDAGVTPPIAQEMVTIETPLAGAMSKNEAPRGYISVPVADSQVLWRFGPAGSIERSADSGATWQRQSSGVAVDLLAGSAPSASVCWAVGRVGMILRTTDGGSTWQQLGSPSSLDLVAIEARDATTATVTTSEGKRYSTADAGRTWRSL